MGELKGMMMLLMLFVVAAFFSLFALAMNWSLRVWRTLKLWEEKQRSLLCAFLCARKTQKAAAMTKKNNNHVLHEEFEWDAFFTWGVMLLCEHCEARGTRYLTLTIQALFHLCWAFFFRGGWNEIMNNDITSGKRAVDDARWLFLKKGGANKKKIVSCRKRNVFVINLKNLWLKYSDEER